MAGKEITEQVMKPHRSMPPIPDILKFVGDVLATVALLIVLKMRPDSAAIVVGGITAVWAARGLGGSVERAARIRGGTGKPANIIPPETVPTSLPAAKKKKAK